MPNYRKRLSPICTQWNKLGDHPAVVAVPPGVPSNELRSGADVTLCGWIYQDGASAGGVAVHPTDWLIDEPDSSDLLVLSDEQFHREYEEIPVDELDNSDEEDDNDVDIQPISKPKFSSRKVSTTKK